MQNIIPLWQCCREPSVVLTKKLGNVPTPKFAIGQTVNREFFCTDPLETEYFMQTHRCKGLIVGQQWEGREWIYYLHFERAAWFQPSGYSQQPVFEEELKPVR